jgi:UDP-N-acetylglucosamine--N-acetylmuramyl-(pentapeptide) pyrophosphoryl-undecaprenol N-acetylglucosamine transferase
MRSWRPDAVIGMGAYLSLAAVWGAWREGIPVLIHESNAKLGLAHRLSLPFASRIALGLPIRGFSDRRAVLTGTPIREAFFSLPSSADARRTLGLAPDKPILLVFGGSQGAQSLNTMAAEAAGLLAGKRGDDFQVLHLAGTRDFARVEAFSRALKVPGKVLPYLENVHEALAASDLVLCRSGASSLAELAATHVPAVLVPYPFATAGHQSDNARVLADAGAAVLREEKDLEARSLFEILDDLIYSRPERRTEMRRAFGKLPLPEPRSAADRLAALAEGVAATEERCSKPS